MYVRVQEKTAYMYENIDKIYYYCKFFKTAMFKHSRHW